MNKEKKIKKFLYNPWFVGATFYLFGLLTPKTVATIKEFSIIKKETNHIDVVGNMYVNEVAVASNKFFFLILLLVLFVVLLFIINSFEERV